MENKSIIVPSTLVSRNGVATYSLKMPNFYECDVSLKLNNDCSSSVFLDHPAEGDLIVQELWTNSKYKIYFDLNANGELIAILPEGFDAYIDENGYLIVHTEDMVFEGIDFWYIQKDLEVQ